MKKFNKLLTLFLLSGFLFGAYGCFLFGSEDDEPEIMSDMSGIIKDARTGEPLPGATVEIAEESKTINAVQTGADGSFKLGNIRQGRYTIRIAKARYVTKELIKNIDENLQITGAEASLMPFGHLAGRITAYESGQPVPGVSIRTNITGSKTSSDENGYYETPQLEDGTYNFSFTKSGYGVASQEFSIVAGELTTGDIQLRQLGGLKGRVSDYETNDPISGVNIEVVGHSSVITDSDGLYAFNNLPEGNYTVTATVSDFESKTKEVSIQPGSPRQENFQLTPTIPELVVSTTNLDFGDDKSSLPVEISNGGRGTLIWSIDEHYDWISVTPTSGENTETSLKSINVKADRSNLTPGPDPHKASFSINSNGGSERVDIFVYVRSAMKVYPSDIDFSTTSSQEQFSIQNTGNSTLEYTIESDLNWITISPINGSVEQGGSEPITIQADRNKLGPGTYDGYITINSNGGENVKVFVQLVVKNNNGPQLTVSPANLDFGTDVTEKNITVSNTGKGNLQWNVSDIPDWLSLDKNNAITASGQATNIRVRAIRGNKNPNQYEARLKFTSDGGEYFVDVVMIIEEKPILKLSETQLDFGSEDNQHTFNISNAGTGKLNWEIVTDQDWLTVEPATGEGAMEIKVFVNREQVSLGDYNGLISIKSNAGERAIGVTMSKTPAPPNLSLKNVELIADGNDSGEANPGESVTYSVTIENSSGVGLAENVRVKFTSPSPYINSFSPAQVSYGDISIKDQKTANVAIEFASNAPIRQPFRINMEIEDRYGKIWYEDFELEVKSFHIVPEGLVAYYTFDDATYTDKAGKFDLFDYGTELSTDIPNNEGLSIDFNAENGNYLRGVENVIYGFEAISFSVWVKINNNNKNFYLYNASAVDNRDINMTRVTDERYVECGYQNQYGPKQWTTFTASLNYPVNLFDNHWHMLTITYDKNFRRLYIDGLKIDQLEGAQLGGTNQTNGFIIGRRGPHDDSYFDGKMDNVRFYNRALTEDEVKLLYQKRL